MKPLQRIFSAVPPRYDLINRLLTWRLDERWRRRAARECLAGKPGAVLDICTGTGDLAIHLASRLQGRSIVAALDFSPPMLTAARSKACGRKVEGIGFLEADTANLPFGDGRFDSIGIAFAFRNLSFHNPLKDRYLSEIFRVIRPGGRFVIVETSQPSNRILRKLFHFYLAVAAGKLGGVLSGQPGAYRYLAHSAVNFYNSREVRKMLLKAGFSEVSHTPLLGGIAGITVAVK